MYLLSISYDARARRGLVVENRPEDVAGIRTGIEKLYEVEEKTIETGRQVPGAMVGKHLTAQHDLIRYLLFDEEKHNRMLNSLASVKKTFVPATEGAGIIERFARSKGRSLHDRRIGRKRKL